jgi:hypothetical protein
MAFALPPDSLLAMHWQQDWDQPDQAEQAEEMEVLAGVVPQGQEGHLRGREKPQKKSVSTRKQQTTEREKAERE